MQLREVHYSLKYWQPKRDHSSQKKLLSPIHKLWQVCKEQFAAAGLCYPPGLGGAGMRDLQCWGSYRSWLLQRRHLLPVSWGERVNNGTSGSWGFAKCGPAGLHCGQPASLPRGGEQQRMRGSRERHRSARAQHSRADYCFQPGVSGSLPRGPYVRCKEKEG